MMVALGAKQTLFAAGAETLAALAPEDKADPRFDEVYLSGERQRPADPETVSLGLDGRCRQRFVDQPEAGDGIAGSALIQAAGRRDSSQRATPKTKFNRGAHKPLSSLEQ
jgi:hypothetical protein